MSLDFQVASLFYKSSSFATSRGNEKIGGTGYCVTYDTDSQSRNVLASPLGEEGHEVAKGWTVVILIMILDVDVTAEGGIIKLIARRAIHNPRPEGPSNLRTLRPIGPVNPKNLSLHNPSTQPSGWKPVNPHSEGVSGRVK